MLPPRLRVFISSPGDVKKERLRAGLISDKLAQQYSRFFTIEAYLWEHEPMLSSAHFQDLIEPPSSFDIVALIVWSRLGTRLPAQTAVREYHGIDGRTPVTGTEWEYEDALRSAQTRGVPDMMVFRNTSNAPIDTQNAAVREASIAQLTALDTFWKLHFADQGTFRYAYDEYDTLEKFAARFEQTLCKVIERRINEGIGLAKGETERQIWPGDPYRGLESYEFEHAPVFFGRDGQVTKATEQLVANAAAGSAFLLVCGASGSGKSSLVKAAVLPRLMKRQRITGIAFLRRAVFRAGAGGADPFFGLARALTLNDDNPDIGLPELVEPGQDTDTLAAHLRGAASSPGYAFGNVLGHLTRTARDKGELLAYEEGKLILVVDQLEELFTVTDITDFNRRLFIELLGGLARSGSVWVITTMRADFWHRAIEIPAFLALTEGTGRFDIAAPTPAEQTEIIRKPANAAGLTFEAHPETQIGLDAVLAQDSAAAPGVLPLLSFTLEELFQDAKKRNSNVLTHASYKALDGLQGAIAKRAVDTVTGLSAEAQAALPGVLRRLVTLTSSDSLVPVSRAVPLDGFRDGTPARRVVDALIAARLLVADESGHVATVRLTHEALIERWKSARDQFMAERRDLETKRIVEEQFRRWNSAARGKRQLLLHNPDLASAVDLANRWGDELGPDERGLIKRSLNRARLAQTLSAAAAVVFAIVAVIALIEGWRAQQAEREAESNYQLALSQAAGSTDILNRGFVEGAINSQLMSDLVKRGQKTVSKLPGRSSEVSAARAKLLIAMSPAMIAIGDTVKARDYAGAAIDIAHALQRDEPQKFEWRKLDAEAHATLGIAMFWAGDNDGAYRANEQSIKEFKELATVAPDDLSIPEKMMAVCEASGDTERSMGDFAGASAAYRDWLALSDDLVKRVSDSTEADFWRSFGADAHLRLGDMQFQAKNYTDAAAEYRQGLTVAQALHDKEPGNAKFLEHLSLAHGKLSDALISSNNLDQAMQEVALNISLSDDLVDEFASNVRWLLYREWAHLRKGRALLALQRYQDAFAEFQQYLKGVETMRARDPGYVSALYDQSNAHQLMGDALRLAGDVAGAEQQYTDALGFARDAVKLSPASNDAARKIFAFAYYRLGLVDELEDKKSEALAAYEQCGAVKFNNATWTPRSTWPDDVVGSCNERHAEIAARPGP